MKLNRKVVFISGGASGIGLACSEAYMREGANVFIMDTNAEAVDFLLKKHHHKPGYFIGDISKENSVQKAIKQSLEHFGRIDAIHNNAGVANPSKSLDETSESEWDLLMGVNLKSILWTTKYGIEALKSSKGCILNTSSMVGELGQNNHAAYAASKGGLNALTKSMALDYAPFGIRVNAVSPAGVWTPMLRSWATQQQDPNSIEKYLDEIHALGYCPEGDVIADASVFLLSDDARFITGCILPVSGGAELGYKR
jgi:meso-butanediol dehydrogenase / (S,S)-butanediol dehydrogenase / diacetyl reductase